MVLAIFTAPRAGHGLGPENVLLLYYDDRSPEVSAGEAIRNHYLTVHGTDVKMLGLRFDTAPPEQISAEDYLSTIRQPILDSGLLTDEIEVIVTTRGLPLRIDNGLPGSDLAKFSSLESELTRIDEIDTVAEMQDSSWIQTDLGRENVLPANPYYKGPNVFTGERAPMEAFDRSSNEGMRLATRLDAFTTSDVIAMIDRAQEPIYAPTHTAYMLIDDNPQAVASDLSQMQRLYNTVLPKHLPDSDLQQDGFTTDNALFEQTTQHVFTTPTPVIGYVGHGVNGGQTPGVQGQIDETGYVLTDLDFEIANGAIFHTYESYNSFTYNADSGASQATQGQIAQWIAKGGTAGLGHVAEPSASSFTVSNEDVLFDMMLSGYTFAEAAWASTRQLSYVNTVVGDPLMRYQAWTPGDFDLNGVVDLADLAVLGDNLGGAPTSYRDGDINGDGMIDLLDMDLLGASFQSLAQGSAQSLAVPEPGCHGLIALCLAVRIAGRRHARSWGAGRRCYEASCAASDSTRANSSTTRRGSSGLLNQRA